MVILLTDMEELAAMKFLPVIVMLPFEGVAGLI
jgi:hypothetical protein